MTNRWKDQPLSRLQYAAAIVAVIALYTLPLGACQVAYVLGWYAS